LIVAGESGVCAGSVVDGDDLSNYDVAGEQQEQKENDSDTLEQLQRELTSHSLGWFVHSAALRCTDIVRTVRISNNINIHCE